jgi:hypothetical protein
MILRVESTHWYFKTGVNKSLIHFLFTGSYKKICDQILYLRQKYFL